MLQLREKCLHRFVSLAVVGCILIPLASCASKTSIATDSETSFTPPQQELDAKNESVKFGVLAIDSAVSVNERYGPLMEYLTEVIGRPFKLVILSQESQFSQVEQDKIDFTTNNPLAAVQIQRLYDTEFLVTHTRPNTGSEFSGLIIVDKDSSIETLNDLKGKNVACVNFQTAAAGCTFQIYHLIQNGIDPFTDFESFIENKSQDNIVLAILNETLDAGFIRTGQLEKMVSKGLIPSLDEVRILAPAQDDFFYSHTTALYPEWPVAALATTESSLSIEVQQALLNIPKDHPALQSLKAEGFIPAVNYQSLNNLVETLQLTSWDAE